VTLAFLSLGFSPLTGKEAVDQCVAFRRQIRSVIVPLEGVSLLLVTHPESRCEVKAVYDRDDERAVEWVKRAEEIAAEIWDTMTRRRKELAV
jgi:hypothetical protein